MSEVENKTATRPIDSLAAQGIKLHLEQGATFLSVPPVVAPLIYDENFLIYYDSSSIVISEIDTGRITHKVPFKDIQKMVLVANTLVVCVSEIYLIDLSSLSRNCCEDDGTIAADRSDQQENADGRSSTPNNKAAGRQYSALTRNSLPISGIVQQLSKALITAIAVHPISENDSKDGPLQDLQFFAVARLNNKVSFYKNSRKLLDCSTNGGPVDLIVSDGVIGYMDREELVLYSLFGERLLSLESTGIVLSFVAGDALYVLCEDGTLAMKKVSEISIQGEEESEQDFAERLEKLGFQQVAGFRTRVVYARYSDGKLFFSDGECVMAYSISTGVTTATDVVSAVHEHSSFHDLSTAFAEDEAAESCERVKKRKKAEHSLSSRTKTGDLEEGEDGSTALVESDGDESSSSSASPVESEAEEDDATLLCSSEGEAEEGDSGHHSPELQQSTGKSAESQYALHSESGEEDEDTKIRFCSDSMVWYGECLIIFGKNRAIRKIFMFNSDVVDAFSYASDTLVMSSLSGWIRWSSHVAGDSDGAGEYILDGKMFRAHQDAVTSMVVCDSLLVTGSRDRTVKVWEIFRSDSRSDLEIRGPIFSQHFEERVTAVDFDREMMAVATHDGSLHLFVPKKSALSPFYSRSNRDITNDEKIADEKVMEVEYECFLTQSVHRKQITSLTLSKNMIVTTSADKSARFYKRNGTLLKKIEGGERYTSSSFDASTSLTAVGSSRGVRVFDSDCNQVHYILTKKPVLASQFYSGYLLVMTDVIRVYDAARTGRCLKSYDFGLRACWSMAMPSFLCAENKILRIRDVSIALHKAEQERMREEREDAILLDKYMAEGRVREEISILAKKDDHKKTFKAIYRGFSRDKGMGFLEMFTGRGSLLAAIMVECPGLKYAEVFNEVLRKRVGGTEVKNKDFLRICERQYEALDDMLAKLRALRYS